MTGLSAKSTLTGKLVLLLVLSLTAILAACSSGSPATTANRATTLRLVSAPGQPNADFFNPFFTTNGGSAYGSQGLLYETLYFTNLYNGTTQPWLANSYSYSSDLTQLTFNLRSGVKWNDGKAFTSADVLFTFQLMQKYPTLDQTAVWSILKSVTAPTPSTVVFTLKNPDSTALFRLGDQIFIVPQHIWQNLSGDPSKFTNDNKPVGTGPYTLSHFDPNLITYQRNPSYWGTQPQVQTIQIPSIKDNTTAIEDMIEGKLDWMGTAWNPSYNTSYTQKNSQINHEWFAASNTVMLYLNLDKAPFNNLLVREAISAAINRSQLPQGAAAYAQVASPTGVIVPTLNKWIAPQYTSLTAQTGTNLAESYLQQAGFKKGSDGFYQNASGKEFSMTLNVVNGWNDWDQDTQFIVNDLKAVGINASINSQSGYAPYYNSISSGNYQAAISWTNAGPTPYYGYQGMLSSANSAPAGQAATGTNFERWDSTTSNGYSAQTDKLITQYEETDSLSTQMQAMAGIEAIMVSQLPAIPLTVNVYWDEYTTANWTGWPSASNPYDSGAPYNAPDAENVILHLSPA
jgi:peptide/nickel transport system substrate-binding protein